MKDNDKGLEIFLGVIFLLFVFGYTFNGNILNSIQNEVTNWIRNPETESANIQPVNNSADATDAEKTNELAHAEALADWDPQTAPNAYKILDVKGYSDVSVQSGHIQYSGFDNLGRTGRAVGSINYNLVQESKGWRAGFASDVDKKLAGWGHNKKITATFPNDIKYRGDMFNRSHLIGDALGGYDHVYTDNGEIDKKASKSQAKNLITGTRFQNVGTNNAVKSGWGGMRYFEDMVVSYLEQHQGCSIYYSVEPVYKDDEIIPRANIVTAISCDSTTSTDKGINVVGIVYNVMPGYTINYYDGTFTKD